ncbi:MAG: hypothetical protein ACI84D_000570 [Thalassolituus oleivorans]|jgi:hypothetical protein
MRIVLAVFGLLLLAQSPVQAQSRHSITGVVVDTSGVGIPGATVVALTKPDSVIARFAISDGNGAFHLRRVAEADYVLQVTFVGFVSQRQDITVAAELDAGTIVLTESVSELGELVVSSDHIPMMLRGDTLTYNAAAFGSRPNATVEDLLRRLPGIEVADDGSIKAQGEDVQNVLVDGKEFFGGDYQVATKNLPSDAVDKVEVYDKQSDMAEFTGVDDGQEQLTINLELTEEAKKGMFGNITGGFGDIERYDGQATINRFTPTTQLALLANINNVNRQGFGFQDYLSFAGGMGGMDIGRGGLSTGGVQIGTDLSDGFSETLSIGLNASHDFGDKTSIRSSYFLSSLDNTQTRSVQQQQLLGSSLSSQTQEASEQVTDNMSHRANLNVEHEFSAGNQLRLRANLAAATSDLTTGGFRQTFATTGLTQNTAQTAYTQGGNTLSGDGRLTWRKLLGDKGTACVGAANLNQHDSETNGDLENTIGLFQAGDLVTYNEILQEQRNMGNTLSQTQRLSVSQPMKGKRVLELSAQRRQVSEDQNKSIWDQVGGVLRLNDALSNGFDRTYSYYQGGLRFDQNRDRIAFGLGLQVQESTLDGVILDRDEEISNGYTHFLPSASFRLKFRQGMNFDARYRTSTREPSMNELQPFTDNSDPLNVYVGNPSLKPEYRHSLSLHYMFFDQFSFVNLFSFVSVTYTDNKIVRSRTIDQQFLQSVTSINSTTDDWNVNGQINYGMPIRPLRVKINLSNRAMYTRGLELINAAENNTRILRNTVEAKVENRSKDIWDIAGGASLTLNDVDYSLNPGLSQSYTNKTVFGEVSWYPSETLEISTKVNYRFFDQDVFGANDNVTLWEAKVSKTLLRQKAEIQLVGLDLLNQNVGVNFSNSGSSVREERIESLGRYVMLKFVYHLSDIGSRSRGGDAIEVHM